MTLNRRITKKKRKLICIHEAGHAVVASVCGKYVEGLHVAPLGATHLEYTSRRGRTRKDISGICVSDSVYDYYIKVPLRLDEYKARKDDFDSFLADFFVDKKNKDDLIEDFKRGLRGQICELLAGAITEGIYLNKKVDWDTSLDDFGTDMEQAFAYCDLFDTYDFSLLVSETEKLLRTKEIWDNLLKLADLLEQAGSLEPDGEDDIPFLPGEIEGWPPTCGCR
jgi:hypothetical protein